MATTTSEGSSGPAKPASRSNRSTSPRSSRRNGALQSLTEHPVAFGAAAAAAGVIAGIAATVGRKAAVQGMAAMTGDWLEMLKTEHRAVIALFDKLEASTSQQTTKRTTLLMQIKHALSKHALEEENVVYPALREGGDKEQADQLNKEHGYVKQYLYELENMPRDDTRWLAKAGELRRDLEQHMADEEERIFPALQARLGPDRNAKLTMAVNKEGFKLA